MQYMTLPTVDTNIKIYNLPFKIFKTKVKSLQNKKIIQSVKQSTKCAFKHLINMSNPSIINVTKNCPLYKKIIYMDIIQLNKIKRNLNIKNILDLKLMKKKMASVNNILNERITQNFDINTTELPKLFNDKKQSYEINFNNLIANIKSKSFPKIIKNKEPFYFDLTITDTPQTTTDIDCITCIEDTPSRQMVPCHKFYKRSMRSDVMGMLKCLIWNKTYMPNILQKTKKNKLYNKK